MSHFGQGDDNSCSSAAPNIMVNVGIKRKRGPNLRSKVWENYERQKIDDDKCLAICNICKKILTATSTNGTSHLTRHTKRCLQKHGKKSAENPTHVFSQVQSRKDLASAIILHEYPLSIVEHVGFRKFVGGLQPDFKFVSRNTIKKDIIKIYDVEKEKTYKLEKVGMVAITTDMWSARPTKKGFMAITAHFIDEKWRLQNRVLTFVYVCIPHNKEALSEVLLESFYEWNIDRKISTITVDNATTNDAVITILLRTMSRSSMLLDGKFLHMRCGAHILNLIVKEGLSVVEDKIQKIRQSCYWTASQTRIEKFEAAAIQLHITVTKGLEIDVKTRWNSSYYMLRAALPYKEVFARLKQRDKCYESLPSDEDWTIAEIICEKLKIFCDVTVLFSGTNYPTANSYFRKICEIKSELAKWLGSPNEVVREMATKMVEKCDKYWSECHVLMGIACVLDPRYKMKLVEYCFNKVFGAESEVHIEKIRQACYDLFDEYLSKSEVTRSDVRSSSSGTNNLDEEDDLNDYDLYVSQTSTGSESELDLYLKEKVVPRDAKFDLLKWWDTEKNFPILQKIARDILAVQVSTVASESTFSASGRLVTPHRSRLHQTTLQALICAQSWLWSDLKESESDDDTEYLPTVLDEEEEPIDEMEGFAGSSEIS